MPNSDEELIVTIGKPIQLPQIDNPKNEDVDKWHKLYMERVVDNFNYYKKEYAHDKNAELQIY